MVSLQHNTLKKACVFRRWQNGGPGSSCRAGPAGSRHSSSRPGSDSSTGRGSGIAKNRSSHCGSRPAPYTPAHSKPAKA